MISKSNRPSGQAPEGDWECQLMRDLSSADPLGAADALSAGERARFIEQTLERGDAPIAFTRRNPTPWYRISAIAAAATFLMGISGALIWMSTSDETLTVAATHPPKASISSILRVDGNAFSGDRTVGVDTIIEFGEDIDVSAGSVLVAPVPGIRVALMENTTASFDYRRKGGGIEILLKKGTVWASVDPSAVEIGLRVLTDEGHVRVTGTVFTVKRTTEGASVAVLRGAVEMMDAGGRRVRVAKAQKGIIGSDALESLDDNAVAAEWEKLAAVGVVASSSVPEPSVDSLAGSRSTMAENQIPMAVGSPVPAMHSKKTTRFGAVRHPSKSSLSTLISDVRTARRNRDWQGAADGYEALIKQHPDAATTKAALVALAELKLEKLNNPRGALQLYEQYLSGDDVALQREALFGKARSLRVLRYPEAEAAVLKQFISRFPTAVQTPTVKRRLQSLEASFPK